MLASRQCLGISAATTPAGDTVAELITAYLLHRKAEVAVRGVRGNKHDRLSDRGFNRMQNGLATLRKFAGARRWGGPTEAEALLADYRKHLKARLLDGTYTAHTFNDKLKHLRPIDVLLTDYHLGDGQGVDLLDGLDRKKPPITVPISAMLARRWRSEPASSGSRRHQEGHLLLRPDPDAASSQERVTVRSMRGRRIRGRGTHG